MLCFQSNLTLILEYDAEVHWEVFTDVLKLALMYPHIILSDTSHSHRLIQTKATGTLAFDCTGEQFGCTGADWLTGSREFTKRMVDMLEETSDGASDYEHMRRIADEQDEGYWHWIIAKFDELFERLEWEEFMQEKTVSIENIFRSTAEKLAEAAVRETWGLKPRY
jgi:ubiquitin C-terminal hydrolase